MVFFFRNIPWRDPESHLVDFDGSDGIEPWSSLGFKNLFWPVGDLRNFPTPSGSFAMPMECCSVVPRPAKEVPMEPMWESVSVLDFQMTKHLQTGVFTNLLLHNLRKIHQNPHVKL